MALPPQKAKRNASPAVAKKRLAITRNGDFTFVLVEGFIKWSPQFQKFFAYASTLRGVSQVPGIIRGWLRGATKTSCRTGT
jgi:hypothetical protein